MQNELHSQAKLGPTPWALLFSNRCWRTRSGAYKGTGKRHLAAAVEHAASGVHRSELRPKVRDFCLSEQLQALRREPATGDSAGQGIDPRLAENARSHSIRWAVDAFDCS